MKRNEITKQYDVDTSGRITSPGKFEGEMIYVPHFWYIGLDGFADRDNGKVFGFDISADDRSEFPELGSKRRTVKLMERDDGFVCEL